ncbi:hypothetical protein [Streptomyces sp. NPDC056468]|uniref:hypothetical protein n=1 Tax=unclassified Streptomyces TaxID=2593676 RepID=UPI003682ECF6
MADEETGPRAKRRRPPLDDGESVIVYGDNRGGQAVAPGAAVPAPVSQRPAAPPSALPQQPDATTAEPDGQEE